jgi:hypothetical protein
MRECRELGGKKRMEVAAEKYFWTGQNYFLQLLFGCFGKWNLDLDLDSSSFDLSHFKYCHT